MTQASSFVTTSNHHDLERQPALILERLEFGKFCVSPEGPIESNRDNIPIEHSQLGWSSGFPQDFIPICYPTSIGITNEDGEGLPLVDSHGTVLRPIIRAEKKIQPVLYRVGSRAEQGENRSGRRYTLARYLVSLSADADPLTMLVAMNEVKLRGIMRSEASDITAIKVGAAKLEYDAVVEAFLQEALIYVLSGIPLSITEEISEAQFFSLVAAVHAKLPPALQPHLSAGWNVGSSYSGRLGITYTTHRAATTALFSPLTLTWFAPEYMTTWNTKNEAVTSKFLESRLEPGRQFEEYILSENSTSSVVSSLPPIDLPEMPDWQNPPTVQILRYPGLKAKDEFALAALERWLTKGEEDSRLWLDAGKLNYQSSKLTAMHSILNALADPSSRPRADRALWVSLSEKTPITFTNLIKGANGQGAARAKLMVALCRGEVTDILGSLTSATNDESEDLPDEAAASLEEILDKSITPAHRKDLAFHEQLLQRPPEQYQEWVKRRALELMKALASKEKTPEGVFDSIKALQPSDTVKTLHELIKGNEPPSDLTVLSQLQPVERSDFADLFNQEWSRIDESTAARRERLLKWFHALKIQGNSHPLLRVLAGEELTDSQVSAVADEVEAQDVPQSLMRAVAVLALKRWSAIGQRITSRARQWCSIASFWPSEYARALVGGGGTDSPDEEIAHAASELKVPSAALQNLINLRYFNDSFHGTAPVLWDLAVRLERRSGSPIAAVDLCAHFADGHLPDVELPANQLGIFVELVKESERLNISSDAVQSMWLSASRSWQMQLLLTLFPGENLMPSPHQLSVLIQIQNWLDRHLHSERIHGSRSNLFKVATQPFQSLPFKDTVWWRDDFIGHPIWGAFKRVPLGMLQPGALRSALRAYTGSDLELPTAAQSDAVIAKQAEMCGRFLDSYRGSASEHPAMLKVLTEFVFRLLKHQSKDTVNAIFASVGADHEFPGYVRPDKLSYHIGPQFHDLVRRIVVFYHHKSMNQIIREYCKNR